MFKGLAKQQVYLSFRPAYVGPPQQLPASLMSHVFGAFRDRMADTTRVPSAPAQALALKMAETMALWVMAGQQSHPCALAGCCLVSSRHWVRCMSVARRIYSKEGDRRDAIIPLLEELLYPYSIDKEYKMVANEDSRVR